MTSLDFVTILPELALAIFAMLALLAGAFGGKDAVARPILWACVAALVAVAAYTGMRAPSQPALAMNGMFIDDAFARFAKVVVLLTAAAVLAMSADYMRRRGFLAFEYPVLVVLTTVGMMLMISAADLITLYMGLELHSLSLYIMASMRRDSTRSAEAGLKYFVLGALSSGLLLYGAALVYGFAGTTQFAGIIATIAGGKLSVGLLFGMVFLIVGLAFKVSAAPFHMWTPDVYEGAPTPVTAFFATAPKVAAMALIARLLVGAFGAAPGDWGQILGALAIISMFIGAIGGIGQRDFKRLMAYSAIAHMGFALLGLAAGSAGGVQAMLIYMTIYALMNVGVFAFIMAMERDGQPITDLASLGQLARAEPLKSLALLVLLFSMAGVPPFLGFFAKLAVLMAVLDAGMVWLATLGMVSFVIGSFYYLRVIYYMYFGEASEGVRLRLAPTGAVMLYASALALTVGAGTVLGADDAAGRAAQALWASVPDAAPEVTAQLD